MHIRHLPIVLAAALLLGSVSTATAGMVVYDFVSYPMDQNGYELAGSIETDGTIGPISAANITSWSFTISKGTDSYFTSSESPLGTLLTSLGLEATATRILLPRSNTVAALDLGENVTYAYLVWYRPGVGVGRDQYVGVLPGNVVGWNADPPQMGAEPWVIAQTAVPEPMTLVLFGGGFFALIWCRFSKRP